VNHPQTPLLARTFPHVDHPSFREPKTDADLFPPGKPLPTLPPVIHLETLTYRDPRVPPPLTREAEHQAFLAYNLARCRAAQAQERASGRQRSAALADLTLWAGRADHLREYLTRMNLPLVPFVYKLRRDHLRDIAADDAMAVGMGALLRGVDRFDASAGFKFSSFAVRIMMNDITRASEVATRKQARCHLGDVAFTLHDADSPDPATIAQGRDDAAQLRRVLANDTAGLTDDEREILVHRFREGKPMTHDAFAERLGVSKERSRQIEMRALAKLRRTLVPAE